MTWHWLVEWVWGRGMAHLGLLRVLEEEGVPVDFIVGETHTHY